MLRAAVILASEQLLDASLLGFSRLRLRLPIVLLSREVLIFALHVLRLLTL